MATLRQCIVEISTPTSTGNQSYTCTDSSGDFQPKVVEFYSCSVAPAAGLSGDQVMMFGAMDGTRQFVGAIREEDNAATSQVVAGNFQNACISVPGVNSTTPLVTAAQVSLDATGFTVNYSVVDAAAHQVFAVAMGGDGLANVYVSAVDSGTGTGSLAVTAPGFTPNLLRTSTARRVVAGTNAYSSTVNGGLSHGATDGTTQFVASIVCEDAQAASDDGHVFHSSSVVMAYTNTGSIQLQCSFTSFDANGFTLNRVVNSGSMAINYIAYDFDVGVVVGLDANKATTGTQTESGLAFDPGLVITTGARQAADQASPATADSHLFLGAFNATDQFVVASGSADAEDPTISGSYSSNTSCYATLNDTISAINDEAAFSSFGTGSYTLNYTTTAGSTRAWGYVALEKVTLAAAITGTATATITEADVVAGGKTIIITLTGDMWVVAAGGLFDAQRQNIIDGLDSAQSEATGWNAEVRDKLAVTTVVRTSDTVVTITLSAQAAYDITAQETITVTVPATATLLGLSAIVGAPTFTVDQISAGGAQISMMLGMGM